MSFVSYAQNFEDVMLWRALQHVDRGFYIDAGAWSPDVDSVTRAFYENDWHGINIEPNPEFHEQLQVRRIRDINLNLAVGDVECAMTMHFCSNSGLSTLDDSIAKRHQAAGLLVKRQDVEVKTLASICEQNVPKGQEVHFLKVDVEGFEKAVLSGNDWVSCRPWVVVVEATEPTLQVESHAIWEPVLRDADYEFAYGDGLNRFYVANEHVDLMLAFRYPPNVFDEFVLVAQQQAEARSQVLQQQSAEAAAQAEARSQVLQQQSAEAAAQAASKQESIERLQSQLEHLEFQLAQLTAQLKKRDQVLEARESVLEQVQAHSQRMQHEWETAKIKVDELNRISHHWWTVAYELNSELKSVYFSRSWRITLPLRELSRVRRDGIDISKSALVRFISPILSQLIRFVVFRPRMKRLALTLIDGFPLLSARLRHFSTQRGLVDPQEEEFETASVSPQKHDLESLSPQALEIYSELKVAVEQNRSKLGNG